MTVRSYAFSFCRGELGNGDRREDADNDRDDEHLDQREAVPMACFKRGSDCLHQCTNTARTVPVIPPEISALRLGMTVELCPISVILQLRYPDPTSRTTAIARTQK